MTQEKDKQEKPKEEQSSNELPDAELDKVSGGADPINTLRSRTPKPVEPINDTK